MRSISSRSANSISPPVENTISLDTDLIVPKQVRHRCKFQTFLNRYRTAPFGCWSCNSNSPTDASDANKVTLKKHATKVSAERNQSPLVLLADKFWEPSLQQKFISFLRRESSATLLAQKAIIEWYQRCLQLADETSLASENTTDCHSISPKRKRESRT